jgi:anti-anti-sigma factor
MGFGLELKLETVDQKVIVRIDGRLDTSSAPILEKKIHALSEENHNHLLLDFSRVSYLSSAGMRVLLSLTKKLSAKKGALLLFSLTDEVEEVIKMAGFDRILHIFSSEKEACQFHPKV